jgi:hypothetical protein
LQLPTYLTTIQMESKKRVLLIEPFHGGSHKQLIDFLLGEVLNEHPSVHLASLPAKKWHWRARTSALNFAQTIPHVSFDILFCSSVLNLAEFVALRPDLAKCHKIVYFHENQLVYPVQQTKERDFQYGYNQVLSALVADRVVFNSRFNQESFLSNIRSHFSLQPDFRPKNLKSDIETKCEVAYFPVQRATNISANNPRLHLDLEVKTMTLLLFLYSSYFLRALSFVAWQR